MSRSRYARPDSRDAAPRPGLDVERHRGRPGGAVHLEPAEHLDERISPIAQGGHDRVGGAAEPEPVEGVAHPERQVAEQASAGQDVLEAGQRQPAHPHRLAFPDPDADVHRTPLPLDQRVDRGLEKPALRVEQPEAQDVALEFPLVEIAFLAQPEDPHHREAGPPARVGRGDRSAQQVVVQRPVALERKTPDHLPLEVFNLRDRGASHRRHRHTQHHQPCRPTDTPSRGAGAGPRPGLAGRLTRSR
jgi:hypothetical protein